MERLWYWATIKAIQIAKKTCVYGDCYDHLCTAEENEHKPGEQ